MGVLAKRNDLGTPELEPLAHFGGGCDGSEIGVRTHRPFGSIGIADVKQAAPEIELKGILDQHRHANTLSETTFPNASRLNRLLTQISLTPGGP